MDDLPRHWDGPAYLGAPDDVRESCLPVCAGERPTCWPLLADPKGVLEDSARWPRHLCYRFMEESIERWVQHCAVFRAPASGAVLGSASWPLSLRSLNDWAGEYFFEGWPLFTEPDMLARTLADEDRTGAADRGGALAVNRGEPDTRPVGPSALAADWGRKSITYTVAWWALRCPLPHGALDLFGLAVPAAWPPAGGVLSHGAGPLALAIRGGASAIEEATPLVKRARRWWHQFTGRSLAGALTAKRNRPPVVSEAAYVGAYDGWVAGHGRHPTQDDVADLLGVTRETVKKNYRRRWGWPPGASRYVNPQIPAP